MSIQVANQLIKQLDKISLSETERDIMRIEILKTLFNNANTAAEPYPARKQESVAIPQDKEIPTNGLVKFTKKEIAQLPKDLQLYFIHANIIVHYRYRPADRLFQTRFRRLGYNINVSSRDYEIMKQKFIEEFNRQTPLLAVPAALVIGHQIHSAPQITSSILFMDYGEQWLETKKTTTKPSTFKDYERTFRKDITPLFGKFKVCEITRAALQKELSRIFKETPRKAEKMHLQLTCIFDMAQEDFQIPSPMKKVTLPFREQKKGSALTKEEERTLLDYCTTKTELAATSALMILHLFGLRSSELASVKLINENWISCVTSKEKLGKNEVERMIPITPFARKFLKYIDFDKARTTAVRTLGTTLNRIFQKAKGAKPHHPHELRYTFITRCKECGVNPELVMLWDGHEEDKDVKSSKVDRGYTDYSEEYQLSQAQLVDYEI